MSSLITTLRGLTNAGTIDYSIAGASYWSDDQLQTALDRHAVPVRDEMLRARSSMASGGAVEYKEYQSKRGHYESTDGGTLRFVIKDSTGAAKGTADWSADYEKGLITFNADTGGAVYYLTGWSYDINAAAADVWYQKAAHASEMIDFSTDGHNIKRSHVANIALKMAQRFEAMSSFAGSSVEAVRGDSNV